MIPILAKRRIFTIKNLVKIKHRSVGRNNHGRITVNHRGGHKTLSYYYILDSKSTLLHIPFLVIEIEKVSFRSG